MEQLVTKRYAKAFYDLAVEVNKVEQLYGQLRWVMDTFKQEKDFFIIFSHPQVVSADKKEILSKIFAGKVDGEILNFLYVLIDKRRESSMMEIFEEFERLTNQYKNIEIAYAESAVPLDEAQIKALTEKLEAKTNKKIQMQIHVDPSLIAGVSVRIGDIFIDGTVLGKIKALKQALKKSQLEPKGV